jgi:phosphate/phosphite/phosphonate ABC transporter binding protein
MKKTGLVVVLLMVFAAAAAASADTYRIGVLAKNGPVKAMKMWKSMGDYLSAKIPDKTFEIVPLGFDEVNPAVESGKVDFFLVNSSMFITTKVRYGTSAIATMVNSRQGQPLKQFGGVMITLAENDGINSIADLKGKQFMAVKESSFGGWQMAYKEMLDAGLDPHKDLGKLEFGGKHDNVVLAVLNGAADAGTVRTDTLERMAAAGYIDMEEFKIVEAKAHSGFPFVCSSALYPEWPMGKCSKTPDAVAREVADALKGMKSEDEAAQSAHIVGWVDPLDYQPIDALQKALKIGAYGG